MWKSILILLLLCTVVLTARPENSVSVKITAMDVISRGADNEWFALGQGSANLTLKSKGNSNVKGQLSLEAIIGEPSLVDISRAFIKVRFPGFRTTLGKTRVSWGEGFFFNAGDLLYGSTSVQADLMSEILRDQACWLTQVYLPLGAFSFAEAVYLPGDLNLQELAADPIGALPALADSSVGGRLVSKLMGVKLEGGYLYSGLTNMHEPYLSFQGNLFVDWHLSASGGFQGGDDPEWETFLDTVRISGGLFHMLKINRISSISLRLEGLLYPQGLWEESDTGLNPGDNYGLYLYPEISWTVNDRMSLTARSVISPIDVSAMIMAGGTWQPYQGFSLLGQAMVQVGEETDIFAWERPGDIALLIGVSFIF